MPKNVQKQQHKKVARNKCNRNWQGSRHNDIEAVDQLFGANEVEIKQKTLEALKLLRQANHALDEIHKYLADCTTAQRTYEPAGSLILGVVRR